MTAINIINHGKTSQQDHMVMVKVSFMSPGGIGRHAWEQFVDKAAVIYLRNPQINRVVQMPDRKRYKVIAIGSELIRNKQVASVYLEEWK